MMRKKTSSREKKGDTVREVSEKLGISVGLAHKIQNLQGCPSRQKYKTEVNYLKALAKFAIKKGHTTKSLREIAAGALSRGRAGANGSGRDDLSVETWADLERQARIRKLELQTEEGRQKIIEEERQAVTAEARALLAPLREAIGGLCKDCQKKIAAAIKAAANG